jgi:threonine dehydrogenase-like Zn-dependent dehydrogenase
MKALLFERNLPRYAAARAAASVVGGLGARVGPLRLADVDQPELPGDDWLRVRPRLAGICGSDLATIDGRSTRWFEPIVSFPFVPGHEIVGDLDDGTRVVVEPVLGCVTRGIEPVCPACARGDLGNCERIAFGRLAPGLQTGFCCDTGGGWSTALVAHQSQVHEVGDDLSDAQAALVEPTACAVHGALAATARGAGAVVVLGAGALGLLTVAALHHLARPDRLLVAAKHPVQRELAAALGAGQVVAPTELRRTIRRATGTMAFGDGPVGRLAGGADVVVDCVGSAESLRETLDIVRPRGRVVLLGMPSQVDIDLTGLWQREIELVGAYAYGTETLSDGSRPRTFDLALDLVQQADLGQLLTNTYALADYERAIEHAAAAGPRGAVKIAFDLRDEKERNHL